MTGREEPVLRLVIRQPVFRGRGLPQQSDCVLRTVLGGRNPRLHDRNRYGRYVLLSKPKIKAADHWFDAYGAGGIFVARLLPGIRHVISIPAGLFEMNFKIFSIMTILGAGFFNTALAWFGMKVLGDQPALMKDPGALITVLKTKSYYLIGFAVVVGLLYWLMTWMHRRAASKQV